MSPKWFVPLLVLALVAQSSGGLLAIGVCQAGCAGVACACFAAAGATMGVATAAVIAATPMLAACNAAYGTCYSACWLALLAPTP